MICPKCGGHDISTKKYIKDKPSFCIDCSCHFVPWQQEEIIKLKAESETYEQLWNEAIDCIRNLGAFLPDILELSKVKTILEQAKVEK